MRFAVVACSMVWLACGSARAEDPKLSLKVMYAGKIGTARARDFGTFLRGRVAEVGTAEFATFRDRDAEGFDVVILDGDPADLDRASDKKTSTGLGWPELTPEFSRPTVLIGAMGGKFAQRRHLKLNWLCNCLDNIAHVISPTHAIFAKPLAPELHVEDFPTPPHYRDWPGGATLDSVIPSWTVQRTAWMGRPGKQAGTEPDALTGLVLDPYGFTDSPDCEAIAAGLNSKSWNALAIARQANFLFWGFASPPSDMTPAGQACFLNSLAYIHKFAGQRPLVERTHAHRTMWLKYASTHGFIDDEAIYATMMPESLRQRLGKNYAGYPAYYRANLEYLHPSGTANVIDIDADALALGLSNRRVESLDRWIRLLETNDHPDRASRLLQRYTVEAFASPRGWRTWFERNRSNLYFTDTGGYKFRITPDGLRAPVAASETPLDPDPQHPLAAELELSSELVHAGGSSP